jgi:UDP-N-acetylglucosamine--N-acetylmuramyl-(pentapeptide) pyrophosphoryl-undecaprenol N-acetylglucosamine transferase
VFSVIHQAGRDREAAVRDTYAESGVEDVEVVSFLEDVAERMTASDLIVARAGAVTVAEISAIGRAALFIPYPHAADDHQAKNALALATTGGALCIRQEAADEERLAAELGALLADDARRVRMADAAREHGRRRAADDVANDLLELAGIPPRAASSNGGHRPSQAAATVVANGSSRLGMTTSERKETS